MAGEKQKHKADKETTQSLSVKKAEDFSEWYNDLVQKAGLADYAPIAGCMIIKPHGYAIWENIKNWFDTRIKATGHKNAYFPLFIPEKFLKREAEHFEGFTPEVAWIVEENEAGQKDRFALRPTSETIINDSFSKWIRSWRDLPLLINQWCNIVRWETKACRIFLRTREFLWQEGHTAHISEQEADKEARMIANLYKELMETQLAVPVLLGIKTPRERFAGALNTYTLEALMPDGKALQMGTSHNLGQNFAKAFNIKYRDKDEKEKMVWQTSWGISTRLIGSVVMTHGDDKGIVLPPNIAPVQAVIVPIIFEGTKTAVIKEACKLCEKLGKKINVECDCREEYSAGWKFNEWEMKGVPLRIEIGPKDLKKRQVVLVRRDTGAKKPAKISELEREVASELKLIQKSLYDNAKKFLDDSIMKAEDMKEIELAVKNKKMAKAEICGSESCEDVIQDKTAATVRLIVENEKPKGKCAICKKPSKHVVYVAKQY